MYKINKERLLMEIIKRLESEGLEVIEDKAGYYVIEDSEGHTVVIDIFNDTVIRLNSFADERELTKNNKMQINK